MYRRGVVEWPSEPNKHPVIAAGRILRLPDSDDLVMIHDRNRSVVEALDRVIRYAPAEAQAMIDRGEVFTARRMFATLGGKARKQYIHGEPWLDGVPGFMRASVLVAFHFYVWACFWELSGSPKTADDDAYVLRLTAPLRAPAEHCPSCQEAARIPPSRPREQPMSRLRSAVAGPHPSHRSTSSWTASSSSLPRPRRRPRPASGSSTATIGRRSPRVVLLPRSAKPASGSSRRSTRTASSCSCSPAWGWIAVASSTSAPATA